MSAQDDLRDDFAVLGVRLRTAVSELSDPEARASGSDVASLARTRRSMGMRAADDFVAEMSKDYEQLGEALAEAKGAGAAAIANERRMIRKALESLRAPEGVTKVAQLASYRAARAQAAGTAPRRRQSR